MIVSFTTIVISHVVKDTICINSDSNKIKNIESELRDYGKQSFLTDKITLVQFIIVVGGGAIINVPTLPLLIITSAINLTITIINWKADRKLSKFNNQKY